jgi:hypothetical protein
MEPGSGVRQDARDQMIRRLSNDPQILIIHRLRKLRRFRFWVDHRDKAKHLLASATGFLVLRGAIELES